MERKWNYLHRWQDLLRNRQLWDKILSDNHNPLDVGYPEQHRMMELIKKNYW